MSVFSKPSNSEVIETAEAVRLRRMIRVRELCATVNGYTGQIDSAMRNLVEGKIGDTLAELHMLKIALIDAEIAERVLYDIRVKLQWLRDEVDDRIRAEEAG